MMNHRLPTRSSKGAGGRVPSRRPGPLLQCLGDDGLALPLLLFLLLALTLLAHGTLLLAQREYRASRAFLHATRSQEAARSALATGLERMSPTDSVLPPDSLTRLLEDRLPEGLERTATLRWLSGELFFLEGEGRSFGWPGVRRVGAMGWRLSPVIRLEAFRGGVEVGGDVFLSGSGVISGEDPRAAPLGWSPEACDPFDPVLDSLFGGREFPATAALPPDPGEWTGKPPGLPGLGLLRGPRLLDLPGTAPGEWGWGVEPEEGQGCPGRGDPLLRIAEDSLTLGEGWWCGVLVASEDVTLRGDGVFQGLILTGGSLRVEGSWVVQGMARVQGDLHVSEAARVDVEACPVLRALEGAPGLRLPFLLPDASNLPLH